MDSWRGSKTEAWHLVIETISKTSRKKKKPI
ncbi:rCG41072 [Rattus norvegicus]|uniref:RCG41072 n=1 Tax=Rattus norvegicus TaxID=10116 RepID=A6K270_RAT|nr:rCG41072 [Rattus norvegicus]